MVEQLQTEQRGEHSLPIQLKRTDFTPRGLAYILLDDQHPIDRPAGFNFGDPLNRGNKRGLASQLVLCVRLWTAGESSHS